MYDNKHLFRELLKNTDENFKKREELIQLHKDNYALASNIKIRKEVEKVYAKGKLKQIKNELNQLKFEKEFANKRNEELLEKMQKDNYKLYELALKSNKSEENLKNIKNKYIKYLEYQYPIIKNEINSYLLNKQNELISLKAYQENQLLINKQKLELENIYYDKILRLNNSVNDQLKELMKENAENEIEIFKKRQEEEYTKREEKSLRLIEELKKERELKQKLLEEEKKERIELNKEIKLDEHEFKNEENNPSIIDKEKLRSEKKPMIKKKQQFEEYYYINDKNHSNGKIDQIRQKKIDYLNETLKKNKKEENFSLLNSQINVNKKSQSSNFDELNNQMKISEEIYNKIINNNIIDLNENSNYLQKLKKKKSEKDEFSKKNIRIEKKEKQLNDINNEIKSNDKNPLKNTILIDKSRKDDNELNIDDESKNDDNEFDVDEESKKSISKKTEKKILNSKISQISNSNISKILDSKISNNNKSEDEKISENNINNSEILFEEKPNLNSKLISVDNKILVLKQLISKIEKYSKTQKPGNYIYKINIINTEKKKEQLKDKFYELLNIIKNEPENINNTFSNLEIDISLNLFYEIFKSNPNNYLNPENLKNNKLYSEKDFDKDLDKNYKIIFDLCLEHLKKMLNEKRISLPVSTNLTSKALLNFEYDEIIQSRLLIVLEQKFRKKKKQNNLNTNKTFSGGFNINSNVQLTSTFNQKNSNSNNFNIANFEEFE